jgi:hypothetical protein
MSEQWKGKQPTSPCEKISFDLIICFFFDQSTYSAVSMISTPVSWAGVVRAICSVGTQPQRAVPISG